MTESLHWQTTLLRTCLVTSSKRRSVEAQKQKPSRKMYSKVLHQAIDQFRGDPLPRRGGRGWQKRIYL